MDIDNYQDIIDVRDIIARYEGLKDESFDGDGNQATLDGEDAQEFSTLEELLDELRGNGGDEQWEGDWYPLTLIRDSYFTKYAQELAEEVGDISGAESWPFSCIDWERAARELQYDYTSVEYDGITYWYR